MLLSNYDSYRKLMFSGGDSDIDVHPEYLPMLNTNGAEMRLMPYSAMYSYFGDFGYWLNNAKCTTFPLGGTTVQSPGYSSAGVWFGSGSTPATKADYKLESPIESGLSITNPTRYTFVDSGDKWEYSASYVLTNTTAADINIYEIGVVTLVGIGSSKYHHVLMERTVLTEPITVPAGGAKLLTLKLTQNNVLNVEA